MSDPIALPNPELTEASEAYLDTEIDRQFPRNDFRGQADATIYPPAGQAVLAPVRLHAFVWESIRN